MSVDVDAKKRMVIVASLLREGIDTSYLVLFLIMPVYFLAGGIGGTTGRSWSLGKAPGSM
jgi:hypothetical protein